MKITFKKKDVITKTVLFITALAIISGYGFLIGKINSTHRLLTQIIAEKHIYPMPMKTSSGTRTTTTDTSSSFQTTDTLTQEIKELKQELRSLAENLKTPGAISLKAASPKNEDSDPVEDSKEFLDCMGYVASISGGQSMTENDIKELQAYKSKLTPRERARVNQEMVRMLNIGELKLENPKLFPMML